jgi:hypothetical protein
MNKWGVRLVGVFFVVWAVHDFFGLLTGQLSQKGFMGLIIENNGHDIAPWIGAFLIIYIGVQLIRLDQKGRLWALILLWLRVVVLGFFLAWTALSPTSNFFSKTDMSVVLHVFYTDWPGVIRGPNSIYLLFVGTFLFHSALTYYLMRKDVIQLFAKADTTESNATNPGTTPA